MSFSYCESVQLDVGAAIEFHSPHHRLHCLVHAGGGGGGGGGGDRERDKHTKG